MTKPIGVAVIGAGMAGRSHAAGYRSATTQYGKGLPEVRLVAIADAVPAFAQETARRFGYERAETSWQAIVDAPDIDVVSIVVANSLHREIAEALAAAGKHVLCEKPFAPTTADGEAMVKAAEEAGIHNAIGFTMRRSPAVAAIREAVLDGQIGRPNHVNMHYWCDYGASPSGPMSWRYRGGPGSGALADIGSHIIDLAEFLAGPISSVSGAVLTTAITERALPAGTAVGHAAAELSDVTEKVDNEDVVTLTARFASGASGTFTASRITWGHPNALGFELSCENGAATFELERMGEFTLFDSTDSRNSGYRRVLVGPDHPYLTGGLPMDFPGVNYGQNDLFTIQARAFLEQVAGVENLPPCPDFAHGLHNLRILDAVVESAAKGGVEVTLDA
jgi:predicted dehydrogenase